jgi:hypothetical protein
MKYECDIVKCREWEAFGWPDSGRIVPPIAIRKDEPIFWLSASFDIIYQVSTRLRNTTAELANGGSGRPERLSSHSKVLQELGMAGFGNICVESD